MESFYQYQPILHIYQYDHDNNFKEMFHHEWIFSFPETKFIAVTHYQNQWINYLKKNYNPHAKGFKATSKAFLDFNKAFDSIPHITLIQIVKEYNLPTAFINLLINLYNKPLNFPNIQNYSDSAYPQIRGLQGCALSLILFTIFLRPHNKKGEALPPYKYFGVYLHTTDITTHARQHSLAEITSFFTKLATISL